MKRCVVDEVRVYKFKCLNEADYFKEVCLDFELSKLAEEEYGISDYDISIRFHDDGNVDVFVYDNEAQETTPIEFTPKIRQELIEFAQKYVQ